MSSKFILKNIRITFLMYDVIKMFQSFTKSSKGEGAKNTWENFWINVAHPETSVYKYCEDTFRGIVNISDCKVDSCRLCCVTTDEVKNTNLGISTLNQCFQKCAETFVPIPLENWIIIIEKFSKITPKVKNDLFKILINQWSFIK